MRINYNPQDKFDLILFIPVIGLIIIGLAAIYSSTVHNPAASGNFERQLIAAIFSIGVFFIIYFLPQQSVRVLSLPSYLFSIVLLFSVIVFGKTVYGAKSWVSIGPVGFQPSEFAKIGMILYLSYWLNLEKKDINNLKQLGGALLIGIIPILLILMEPDMGTAIVFVVILLTVIFWSGISLFGIFVVLSPGISLTASLFGTIPFIIELLLILIALYFFKKDLFNSAAIFVINLASGFIFNYGFRLLRPHQQKRIITFLNPNADPLGAGYNALQAKVAIGSGGFFGKGFLHGNQTQLRFIPEQWTDFIYCVIGEEFGFIGSVIVIALYLIIFLRLLNLAATIKNRFRSGIIIGVLAMLFVHFAINIGMNLGITPVIGLPLPFMSYGGSSLLSNMIVLAIVFNIYRNRKQHV